MADIAALVQEKREEVLNIAARHGVARIRVFGSVARGEGTVRSDIDFLIEVGGATTPWFPGGLVADLENLLGRPVDVVEPEALHEEYRGRVIREAVPL